MIYSQKFLDCVAFTLGEEGGAVNDPRDPGGDTAEGGITEAIWKSWCDRTPGHAGRPLSSCKREDALAIYYSLYWETHDLEQVSQPWAAVIFDACINLAWGAGVKLAQFAAKTAGVYGGPLDGRMSPLFIKAINAAPQAALIAAYMRGGYHVAKTEACFLNGSVNRVKALKALVMKEISAPPAPPAETVEHGTVTADADGRQHVAFSKE